MGDRQTAIERTKDAMHWWTSIQLDVSNRTENTNAAELPKHITLAKQTDFHYVETAAGERRLTISQLLEDGRISRTENYFDGRKATTVMFDHYDPAKQAQVSISDSFGAEAVMGGTNRPTPLKYDYVGKVPLYEALEKARDLGEEEVASTPCDKYMFDDVVFGQTPQNLLYFIRRQDSLPIRIESYNGPDPSTAHKNWVWEAEKVDVVDGRPFVMKSTLTAYTRDSTAVRSTTQSEVKQIAFNVKVGKETFRPVITPEARVDDTITGKVRLPVRKESEAQASTAPPPAADVGVAVPPAGWAPTLTYSAYGLGATLVVVALVLSRRR